MIPSSSPSAPARGRPTRTPPATGRWRGALLCLALAGLAACDDPPTAAAAAYRLESLGGGEQVGEIRAPAPQDLAVRVREAGGAVAVGVPVEWRVLEGAAGVERTLVPSDSAGISRVRVSFGAEPGPVLVLARVGDQSVRFRLSARRFWRLAGAGAAHSCALSRQGEAFCWGANALGQLGDDSETPRPLPVPVFGNPVFDTLAVGWDHTCALGPGGEAFCWGGNQQGQLGVGDRDLRRRPTRVPLPEPATALGAGYLYTCAVLASGALYCWGSNARGTLGTPATAERCGDDPCALRPVRVETAVRFRTLAAGEFHACAVALDGRAYCWGWNSAGEVGTGEIPGATYPRPTPVLGDTLRFRSLAAHARHTCAVSAEGRAFCWGRSAKGETGQPDHVWDPVPVPGALAVRAVATGSVYTCLLTVQLETACMGDQADRETVVVPRPLPAPPFEQLSAGAGPTCGVAEGEVWCWGSNLQGQVSGALPEPFFAVPTRVPFPEWPYGAPAGGSAAAGSPAPAPTATLRNGT